MNAYSPGLAHACGLRFFTVITRTGIRLCAWASSREDACSKVHDGARAWEGFEPLPPANENGTGRDFTPEDVTAFAELDED